MLNMRYLPHTNTDIANMLSTIGKPTIHALFASIPEANKLQRPLKLEAALSELELKQILLKRAGNPPALSFLGAGATAHFVPEMVSQMLLRSEWYTAYTPYQPEASQGTLQAIFEFQTIVANIYGCEIANASMYDGATAFAESLLMALRLRPNTKKVVVSHAIHPEYRSVAATYLHAAGFEMICCDLNAITVPEDAAAIAYQTPNFFGQLENQRHIIDYAHQHNLLAIAVNTDPAAFGIIESPGNLGADIVVGEGLGFCGHLHLGAPGVGLFATKQQFVRQMPGRLCGETVDQDGKRGFVLTLSTREQHIRREKATSNICTNHGLMALAFTISLSLYGKTGFRELAKRNLAHTTEFRQKANEAGLEIAFAGPYFNETVIRFDSAKTLQQKLLHAAKQDIHIGVDLGRWYPQYAGHLLVNTTEMHSSEAITTLVKELTHA